MAILKNRTQGNFTMISNSILRDKKLNMKDRGVLCTICSLPDGWEFSVKGLAALVPDGKEAIARSLTNLEALGYMRRRKVRGKNGRFCSEIEVFAERKVEKHHDGFSVTDKPSRLNRHGRTVTENPTQYNNDNEIKTDKKEKSKSINLSGEKMDGEMDQEVYREMIAENIDLEGLRLIAEGRNHEEVRMVNEIYSVICDMVCYPRETVKIKDVVYPWQAVKSSFLKLRYEHIVTVLNRMLDANLGIKNMHAYLVSSLYTASMVGTIETEAEIHDDYLKYLRGNPYS